MTPVLVSALTATILFLIGAPAAAEEDPDEPEISAGTTDGGLTAGAINATPGNATPGPAPSISNDSGDPQSGPTIQVAPTCVSTDQVPSSVLGTSSATFCEDPEPATPVLTVGDVQRAFARLDLPAATLVIQPPDGLTLVNFDTNFYTTSTEPMTRTVTLLGQRVSLEATPSEFQWAFGDGHVVSTTEPGAPYPDLTVTHNYPKKGTYRPSLDTVYTGRFRVGAGPWQQIPGTVTIAGTPQLLRAIEAQPKLVGY